MIVITGLIALAALDVPAAASANPAEPTLGELSAVPDEILGSWQMVGERCEEGETPGTRQLSVVLRLDSHFRYELSVAGWRSVGGYRVDRFRDSPLRIQLRDTLYEFDFVGGRLENWSEGDAVYLCGRIFERIADGA